MKTLEEVIEEIKTKAGKYNPKRINIEWFNSKNMLQEWWAFKHLIETQELTYITMVEKLNFTPNPSLYGQREKGCINCGNSTVFISIPLGYRKYCSASCGIKYTSKRLNPYRNKTKDEIDSSTNKRKDTNLEIYGFESHMQSKEIRDKTSRTKLDFNEEKKAEINDKKKHTKLVTYGNENYNNNEKRESTMLQRYGVRNTLESSEITNRELINKTLLEKYGSLCAITSNSEAAAKSKETMLSRYGRIHFTNPAKQSETRKNMDKDEIENIQAKRKNTMLEKHGDCNYNNLNQIKETNMNRYGVEFFSQTGISETSGYKWKEYRLPSGKIIKLQGYENFLLDELLTEYSEESIITSRKEMPEFWYDYDNKSRRYFPDVYIKDTNTIYEVKSLYTLNVSKDKNDLKFKSVTDAGYNFTLKIYDRSGIELLK